VGLEPTLYRFLVDSLCQLGYLGMATMKGLEPSTFGLTSQCSNQTELHRRVNWRSPESLDSPASSRQAMVDDRLNYSRGFSERTGTTRQLLPPGRSSTAGMEGIEPSPTGLEPVVLPLNYIPMVRHTGEGTADITCNGMVGPDTLFGISLQLSRVNPVTLTLMDSFREFRSRPP
jgi:hypothetical protein